VAAHDGAVLPRLVEYIRLGVVQWQGLRPGTTLPSLGTGFHSWEMKRTEQALALVAALVVARVASVPEVVMGHLDTVMQLWGCHQGGVGMMAMRVVTELAGTSEDVQSRIARDMAGIGRAMALLCRSGQPPRAQGHACVVVRALVLHNKSMQLLAHTHAAITVLSALVLGRRGVKGDQDRTWLAHMAMWALGAVVADVAFIQDELIARTHALPAVIHALKVGGGYDAVCVEALQGMVHGSIKAKFLAGRAGAMRVLGSVLVRTPPEEGNHWGRIVQCMASLVDGCSFNLEALIGHPAAVKAVVESLEVAPVHGMPLLAKLGGGTINLILGDRNRSFYRMCRKLGWVSRLVVLLRRGGLVTELAATSLAQACKRDRGTTKALCAEADACGALVDAAFVPKGQEPGLLQVQQVAAALGALKRMCSVQPKVLAGVAALPHVAPGLRVMADASFPCAIVKRRAKSLLHRMKGLAPQPPGPAVVKDLVGQLPQAPAEGASCAICQDGGTGAAPPVFLPCLHTFHAECIEFWLARGGKDACPLCCLPVLGSIQKLRMGVIMQ
jgi:hypothetical protein